EIVLSLNQSEWWNLKPEILKKLKLNGSIDETVKQLEGIQETYDVKYDIYFPPK
ncbi:unnamed protein product, partial [marine sediment metagenome]